MPEFAGSFERTVQEKVALPSSELVGSQDFVHRIAYRQSPRVDAMCAAIDAIDAHSPLQTLLKKFAVWSLRQQAQARGGKVKPPEKRRFEHVIEVIGYALLGLGVADDPSPTLDETALVNIEEQFQDLHPGIDTELPFGLFRKFLRLASTGAAAREAGPLPLP